MPASMERMDRIYLAAQALANIANDMAEGNYISAAFALNLAAEAARCNALTLIPAGEREAFLAGLDLLNRCGVSASEGVVAKKDAEISDAVSTATRGAL